MPATVHDLRPRLDRVALALFAARLALGAWRQHWRHR